jgi:hypothetical protein
MSYDSAFVQLHPYYDLISAGDFPLLFRLLHENLDCSVSNISKTENKSTCLKAEKGV